MTIPALSLVLAALPFPACQLEAPAPQREVVVVPLEEALRVEGSLYFDGGARAEGGWPAGIAAVAASAWTAGSSGAPAPGDGPPHELELLLAPAALELRFACAPEQLEATLETLAERIVEPRYGEAALAAALERASEEALAAVLDPARVADAAILELVFGAPQRSRPPHELERLAPDELARFHRALFGGGPRRIVLAGPLEVARARALVDAAFDSSPPAALPAAGAPLEGGTQLVDLPSDTSSELRLAARLPAASARELALLDLWCRELALGGRGLPALARGAQERAPAQLALAGCGGEWALVLRSRVPHERAGATLERARALIAADALLRPGAAPAEEALAGALARGARDALEAARAGLVPLTPAPAAAELAAALERLLGTARWTALACGPADALAARLEGERAHLPAAHAPLPPLLPALERLFAAVGGRRAWAEVGAVRLDIETGATAQARRIEQWIDLRDGRSRLVLGGLVLVDDGERLLQEDGGQRTDLGADAAHRLRGRIGRQYWSILSGLARGERYRVLEADELRLRLVDPSGVELELALDAEGRPMELRYTDAQGATRRAFEAFESAGGRLHPTRFEDRESAQATRVHAARSLAFVPPGLLRH